MSWVGDMMTETVNFKMRKKARLLAMQAIYQWQMSGNELHVIELQFNQHNDVLKVDMDYFKDLLYGIPQHLSEIDSVFTKQLDRTIDELTPIELAVLRLSVFELIKRLDIPYKVVINEALSLTRKFGSTCGYKYVNAVLDKVAKDVRQIECSKTDI